MCRGILTPQRADRRMHRLVCEKLRENPVLQGVFCSVLCVLWCVCCMYGMVLYSVVYERLYLCVCVCMGAEELFFSFRFTLQYE